MKVILLLLFFLAFSLQAETIKGKIESIDHGQKDSPHLVFLQNGLVLFLDPLQENLFHSVLLSAKNQQSLEYEVDQNQNILSIRTAEVDFPNKVNLPSNVTTDYQPTILEDQESAYRIFEKMRRDFKEESGQCYNMAHVWAYEEFLRNGTQSIKLFMFFTTKYIRKYRFHWWFHVSPAVFAKSSHGVLRLSLDRRYTTYPMAIKEWTDHFIESGRACKEVKKHSEYHRASKLEDCYLIEASMYYWQPRDVRLRENDGRIKNTFSKRETQYALKEAFN